MPAALMAAAAAGEVRNLNKALAASASGAVLDAELGFAARHEFGARLSRGVGVQYRFGFDLFGDTQAIEYVLELDTTRTADRRVRIDDRFGREQRAPERFDGADVRLWRPHANCHANTYAGEDHAVTRCDLALFNEVVDRGAGHDDIHDLTV